MSNKIFDAMKFNVLSAGVVCGRMLTKFRGMLGLFDQVSMM